MSDTLYAGGYGGIHKRCKFQAGNVVYLCRIHSPREVKRSTLAYEMQRAVVLGYNKWQFGHYTIMFADGHKAQVLGAMLKKVKDTPDPGTYEGWEKLVKPDDYEFRTPKPDKEDERRRLISMRRYGFRTSNLVDKEYNLEKLFHKVVSYEIIAQCPYFGVFSKDTYPLDDTVKAVGMDYHCVSIVRVIHDVINNGHHIGRRIDYVTCVPGQRGSTQRVSSHVPRDSYCLKMYATGTMKALLNRFYTSKHVLELASAVAIVADPDFGCVLDI